MKTVLDYFDVCLSDVLHRCMNIAHRTCENTNCSLNFNCIFLCIFFTVLKIRMRIDTKPAIIEPEMNLRPMFCELGALTRADGSALLTQGKHKSF